MQDQVTIDAVHQYAYCPRRCFLMYAEGLMEDNAYVADGRIVHTRVDKKEQVIKEESKDQCSEDDQKPEVVKSLSASSTAYGFNGKLDLAEFSGNKAVPVDYKRGSVPNIEGNAWPPERIQLALQGLLLKEMGYDCEYGYLYFAQSRKNVRVDFDECLLNLAKECIEKTKELLNQDNRPKCLSFSPKCQGCSLAGICLPDEENALEELENVENNNVTIRRLYPPRSNGYPLYIQAQGAWVGCQKGLLKIKTKEGEETSVKLKDLDHLVICGNVQISTQAIHVLCENDIPICYLSAGFWFYGMTSGFALKNSYNRAALFQAATNPLKCIEFAKEVVKTKGKNQRTLLRRNCNAGQNGPLMSMKEIIDRVDEENSIETLLASEGNIARIYFSSFHSMLKNEEFSAMFDENGRERRPPKDPVNSLLSYGYAILVKECVIALHAVGLDPYWGLYHRPRHGKPALALDLMEEFRAVIVDSTVITAINSNIIVREDFLIGKNACVLKPTGKKAFVKALESRMDRIITHPIFGYRVSWRQAIRVQARLLARWLSGEIGKYTGIIVR